MSDVDVLARTMLQTILDALPTRPFGGTASSDWTSTGSGPADRSIWVRQDAPAGGTGSRYNMEDLPLGANTVVGRPGAGDIAAIGLSASQVLGRGPSGDVRAVDFSEIGGGGGATNLGDLADVDVAGAANNSVIMLSSGTWVDVPLLHNLLDGVVHPDTTFGVATRGNAIVANASNLWGVTSPGSSGDVLRFDGADSAFAPLQVGDIPALAYVPLAGGTMTGTLTITTASATIFDVESILLGPVMQFRKAGNISSSTGTVKNNGPLGTLNFDGKANGGYETGASIQVAAIEDWSPSAQGTDITISTCPIGEFDLAATFIIRHDQCKFAGPVLMTSDAPLRCRDSDTYVASLNAGYLDLHAGTGIRLGVGVAGIGPTITAAGVVNSENSVRFTSAVGGARPILETIGDNDASVGLTVKTKGGGTVRLEHPNGSQHVDFQMQANPPKLAVPTGSFDIETTNGLMKLRSTTNEIHLYAFKGVEIYGIGAQGKLTVDGPIFASTFIGGPMVFPASTGIVYSDTATDQPTHEFQRLGGDEENPTAVQNGWNLGRFAYQGAWDTSGSTVDAFSIEVVATENWSGSGRGADTIFKATPAGLPSPMEIFRIGGSGALALTMEAAAEIRLAGTANEYPKFYHDGTGGLVLDGRTGQSVFVKINTATEFEFSATQLDFNNNNIANVGTINGVSPAAWLIDVEDDTSPVLGGDLDCAGFDIEDVGFFLDSNGNEILELVEATSAANYVSIEAGGTSKPVEVYASGSDANVELQLRSKGTGKLSLMVDSGGTGKLIGFTASTLSYETGFSDWNCTWSSSEWKLTYGAVFVRFTSGGVCDASGGFSDNGTAGVDGSFLDRNSNTVTVSGGIITALT